MKESKPPQTERTGSHVSNSNISRKYVVVFTMTHLPNVGVVVWWCGPNKGIRQGASQKKRDWSTMPIININSNVVIYNKSNNVINIIGNSETGNSWFLIFFLYLRCFLCFLLPCLPCLMCQTSHKLKISLLLIQDNSLIILIRKSIWYESEQMSMATVTSIKVDGNCLFVTRNTFLCALRLLDHV